MVDSLMYMYMNSINIDSTWQGSENNINPCNECVAMSVLLSFLHVTSNTHSTILQGVTSGNSWQSYGRGCHCIPHFCHRGKGHRASGKQQCHTPPCTAKGPSCNTMCDYIGGAIDIITSSNMARTLCLLQWYDVWLLASYSVLIQG